MKKKLVSPNSTMDMDDAKRTSRDVAVGFKCEHCNSPLPNGIDVSMIIGAMESGTLQSLRDRGFLP